MRSRILLLLVFVCSISVFAQTAKNKRFTQPQQILPEANSFNQLPIRRVIIYSNGMAYIERRGVVTGRAEINLPFKQSQVDDVLKSMIVLDLGRGRIGAVSYNSSVPASARTAEIPFNIESATEDDSGGLAGVLAQLQGAKVLVVSTRGTATGAILNVEKRKNDKNENDEKIIGPMRYSLVISSDSGEIASFDLADVRSVKLLDDDTRRDINEFASATAAARRRDAKTINIVSEGEGRREMIVSYTVSAPIWKTTYRVVLDNEGKPFFQGWAIVDNVSEEDWLGVELSLVSGSPVSFIQPLQNPLYRYRPVVEIPEDLNLEPQIYDPTTGTGNGSGIGDGQGSGVGNGSGTGVGSTINSLQMSSLPVTTSISTVLTSENSGVQTAAVGEEFGDLFEYRIEQPVTVVRNRSALIPILQTRMEGERVSIYNESIRADRPMSGMLLNNTSLLTLENGSLTVIDRDAYAGEALLERLKPKEKRFISFALDLSTLVTTKRVEAREPAKLVKAVNGAFEVHYFKTDKKTYMLTNQTDKSKTVFVEHPFRDKWILAEENQKPFETTKNSYRFRIDLQPFESKVLTVAERLPLMDSYQISALTRQDLELFVSRRYINQEIEQKLNRILDLRAQMGQITAKLSSLDDEEKRISVDQARLRENIEALAKTPEAKQLIARYISKANEQETRIEEINKERQKLRIDRTLYESELAKMIRDFNF